METPPNLHVRIPHDLSELLRSIAAREARTIPKQLEYILRRALAAELAAARKAAD